MAIVLAFAALANAHHEARHVEEEEKGPEVVLPVEDVDNTDQQNVPQVRHHIYMPLTYGTAPAPRRNNPAPIIPNPAPIIQYVPVYTDPRFITLGLGAYGNLGPYAR